MRRLLFLLFALLGAGCVTTGPYVAPEARTAPPLPEGEVAHTVYLTGNTGDLATEAVLRALADDARSQGEGATVVLLGDLTEAGLPPADDPGRAAAEIPLRAVVDALSGIEGEVLAVPGDRDWARGEDGLKRIEDVLDEAFDADVLTPGDQAGGPREWDPAEGLRLVALDTGWWLLDGPRPDGEAEDQSVRTPGDVARILEQIVVDRADDRVVVLAHHPLVSRGPAAGARRNPLAALVSRTFGTSGQDLAAPDYREMRDVFDRIAAAHERLTWASGHDPILLTVVEEAPQDRQQVHLGSGTGGGEAGPIRRGGARHAAGAAGYQRLVYFADGRLWAETVVVDPASGAAEVAVRTEVAGPNAELLDPEVPEAVASERLPETIGATVTTALDADFAASPPFSNSGLTRALFGRRYRDLWKTPIEVPVVDMGTEAGGLTPVKRSGGNQTTGLRLASGDGHPYDFRLLEKGGTGGLPSELRDGLASDVLLELRAAATPYGGIVTAALSADAGVPTPRPEIVYIPDDPRLGRYRDAFGDRLATLEVRPDDDVSDVPGFEGFTDVISDESLREELREDQDHRVDQRAFLRARLLDLLVADWDRHAGQWRWGAFEPGELDPSLTGDAATQGKVYLPVPRDHDWAMYGIGGLVQPILFLFDTRLQGVGEGYGSLVGLTTNGFFQDRRFLNALPLDDWRAIATDLQDRLDDDAIDRALAVLPAPIQAEVAPEWRRILRGRRDGLVDVAERYYGLHARVVDVVGSDEREAFALARLGDGRLEVVIRSFKGGEDGRELYRRTLDPSETDEVRLYGLGGRDVFRVTGDGPASVDVRIIAGAGDDELVAPAGRVAVYDTPNGLRITEAGRGLADRRSDAPGVNRYDPTERILGDVRTFPVVGFQATDGALLGLSRTWFVPGFRLQPFAASHMLAANYATATGGVEGTYSGRMREAVGTFDLDVDLLASTPRYARNFYGLGNGSAFIDNEFAEVDLARVQLRAGLGAPVGEGVRLVAGPLVRYADAARDTSRLVLPLTDLTSSFAPPTPAGGLPEAAFDGQTHAGGFARLELAAVDRAVNPRQGIRLGAEATLHAGVAGAAETYGTVGGEAALYVPLSLAPQATLALRAGATHVAGAFPFFDAAVLGGPGSLRGYRRERFAGRTAASGSAELRMKLFDVSAYVLPLQVGVLGFADAGRVWADVTECTDVATPEACAVIDFEGADPDAGDDLQLGYGGGLWIGVLDYGLLNLTVGASDESTLVTLGLGFTY
ncbi:MAG: BamA/TamA family outer membrane protein [Bacteroidota bacterium]